MSEFGGDPGIIQPEESRNTERGNTAEGHPLSVNEEAMVARRAAFMEKAGIPATREVDPETEVATLTSYSEEDALNDYREGNFGGSGPEGG